MAFNPTEVEDLLVQTGRRCCICKILHRVSIHHIDPLYNGGLDHIENAIPLCPTCHDEVHTTYAPGRSTRSYSPSELRKHRQNTIDMVKVLPTEAPPQSISVAAPSTLSTYQSARTALASSDSAKKVIRLAIRLRDLIISARVPFVLEGEIEAGRKRLEEANVSFDNKNDTELIWYNRWKPIQEANVELSKEAMEAEIFFGSEARELIWNLQRLTGNFGIDLNAYLKLTSSHISGPDPMREQLYRAVYNVADSAEAEEFETTLKATANSIVNYFRPYL